MNRWEQQHLVSACSQSLPHVQSGIGRESRCASTTTITGPSSTMCKKPRFKRFGGSRALGCKREAVHCTHTWLTMPLLRIRTTSSRFAASTLKIPPSPLCAHAVGVSMLAGSLAGITEHAVIFPVDSIKASRWRLRSDRPRRRLDRPRALTIFPSITRRRGCRSLQLNLLRYTQA